MPTLEALEYERFDFSEVKARPLTLEEATRKAAELRSKDPGNFYRIEASNASGTAFSVKFVSAVDLYSDLLSHIAKVMSRYHRRRV